MTITEQVTKNIINKLLKGEDYRKEIIALINDDFLQYAITFFKQIIEAKLNDKSIDLNWYKQAFLLDPKLSKVDVAINSGLNMKTIGNMFNSTSKQVVIDASIDHYETLYNSIKELVETEKEVELTLTIKLKGVSVELNVSETLIVINTLAVKRAAIRGGLWSTAGKQVEKPLMLTLCKLFSVQEDNYRAVLKSKKQKEIFQREIDFYLIKDDVHYKCEVKLMGKGNSESADAVIARSSKVFVADKLSLTNIAQLKSLNVEWVELRQEYGFRRFKKVLDNLNIPHTDYQGTDLEQDLNVIFKDVFAGQ